MGRAISEAYPEARIVFQEVDDALNENLSELVWEGDLNELTLTENAQPALMATSLAAFRALQSEGLGLDGVDYVAGHSLGEYSALAIAGALSVADTARLLRKRGQAMQTAVPVGVGTMAAILGLDFAAVAKLAAEAAQGDICQAANDNDPGQVVVSGHVGAVERAIALAKMELSVRAQERLLQTLHENLQQVREETREEAARAMDVFAKQYWTIKNVDIARKVIEPLLTSLRADVCSSRSGAALGLGVLPSELVCCDSELSSRLVKDLVRGMSSSSSFFFVHSLSHHTHQIHNQTHSNSYETV